MKKDRPGGKLRIVFAMTACFIAGACQKEAARTLNLSGTLEMTEHSVGARVPGRLAEIFFEEGQEVKRGQLLAVLDRRSQSRKDYDRAVRLFREGGGTEQSMEQAKLALEDQEITSPVDGVVLTKVRQSGEVVSAGSAVAVIGDSAELWVRVYVPESQINRLRLNQSAALRFDGLARSLQGHVRFIAPKAEYTPRNVQTPEERIAQTFAVKVALDEREMFLKPGVAADVTIPLGN